MRASQCAWPFQVKWWNACPPRTRWSSPWWTSTAFAGGSVFPACPEARSGDYVIVHAGIAINRLDRDEAQRLLEELHRMGELMDAESEEP